MMDAEYNSNSNSSGSSNSKSSISIDYPSQNPSVDISNTSNSMMQQMESDPLIPTSMNHDGSESMQATENHDKFMKREQMNGFQDGTSHHDDYADHTSSHNEWSASASASASASNLEHSTPVRPSLSITSPMLHTHSISHTAHYAHPHTHSYSKHHYDPSTYDTSQQQQYSSPATTSSTSTQAQQQQQQQQ